jgi:hypothetical protein
MTTDGGTTAMIDGDEESDTVATTEAGKDREMGAGTAAADTTETQTTSGRVPAGEAVPRK